ncbi:hypothetical protein JQX13_15090 [Archangium violaceum]|uniref:hypothetical protein n=1 Tax=Archangium violaceum TaxID=83451 RepID=UPI00193BEC28|nr:hypothetical protein [Archangium violaceum]QRK11279.1 hypothetical protein JQX13_15090 [Archangium violaceum]
MTRPTLPSIESLDLDTLMAQAERIAVERYDGHFTLMRFTTGWKCMHGTPNVDEDGRIEVSALPTFGSAREALASFICADKVSAAS